MTGLPRLEIRLQEWQAVVRHDLTLVDADYRLMDQLANDRPLRFIVEELAKGVRFKALEWVGVISFTRFDVVIEPKLAGGAINLIAMIDYTAGLRTLKRLNASSMLDAVGNSLFDLFALLLSDACAALVRNGLLVDYVLREDALPAVRGRILPDRQLTKRFGQLDRIECRYDEHDADTPENHILATALSLCTTKVKDSAVRLRIRSLHGMFQEMCDPIGADLPLLRATMTYHRLNEHYRTAHDLAWLVFDGLGLRDLEHRGHTECFAFLFDMNMLFEQFVSRLFEMIGSRAGVRVQAQRQDRSILWNERLGKSYARVIPDLLLGKRGSALADLPVDAKYKLYDQGKVSNADLYQTLLYALAYGSTQSGLPRALLVYPSAIPDPRDEVVSVRTQHGHRIGCVTILGLHIPSLLKELQSNAHGPALNRVEDHVAQLVTTTEPS